MPKKDCCCALSVWTISGNGNIVAKPVCQSYVIISSIITSWVWHTFKRWRIMAGVLIVIFEMTVIPEYFSPGIFSVKTYDNGQASSHDADVHSCSKREYLACQ